MNIAMFIMNFFEAEKFGVSETVVQFYGRENWVYLIRTFTPLTIFYRFHSSVCLAEIWKNTYAERIKAHGFENRARVPDLRKIYTERANGHGHDGHPNGHGHDGYRDDYGHYQDRDGRDGHPYNRNDRQNVINIRVRDESSHF